MKCRLLCVERELIVKSSKPCLLIHEPPTKRPNPNRLEYLEFLDKSGGIARNRVGNQMNETDEWPNWSRAASYLTKDELRTIRRGLRLGSHRYMKGGWVLRNESFDAEVTIATSDAPAAVYRAFYVQLFMHPPTGRILPREVLGSKLYKRPYCSRPRTPQPL